LTDEPVLAIVGPTAVGKTDVAVGVALRLGAEIISADSMAVYRGADIGTAKPTAEQRVLVPFHLLDVAEPCEAFNVSEFRRLALLALKGIQHRGHRAVLVGGTGLYVRAILDGLGLTCVPADKRVRRLLSERAASEGARALHTELAGIDPATAARLHPNDAVRIIRALEVYQVTGRPMSEWLDHDAATRSEVPSIRIGLTMDRVELDRRIEARVDGMLAAGLVAEVERLWRLPRPVTGGVMQGLGYREIGQYLDGRVSLADAVASIKKNTRRYARRQMTWFRADRRIHWIVTTGLSVNDVVYSVLKIVAQNTKGKNDHAESTTEPAGHVPESGPKG